MPRVAPGRTRFTLPTSIERLVYSARAYSWLVDPRRLLTIPEFPIDRPIFLLGTQGGGLTLLSRMLRRHPSTVSAAGNSSYWTSADEIQNVFGPILPAELAGLRFKAPPHPVFRSHRSWTYAARDLYPLYRKTSSDATPELRKALQRVIRLCIRRHARDPYNCRLVDKSQVFTVRVGLIHQLLDGCDPRFVLVVRDPYSAVFRAAVGGAADMRYLADSLSLEERIDICAEHYANSLRAVYQDVKDLGVALHLVRLEDLITLAEPVLRQVCDFVELQFQPNLLPDIQDDLPLGTRYRDRWFPLNPDVNQRYEAAIEDWMVHTVNRHLGSLVEELGYVRR